MQSKDNENGVRSPRVDLSATKAHEAPTVMISNDKASDQTKLSMECQVKDDDYKICKICGDKALGYNFNVISCESCKAFFRRNAMKSKVSFGNCQTEKMKYPNKGLGILLGPEIQTFDGSPYHWYIFIRT